MKPKISPIIKNISFNVSSHYLDNNYEFKVEIDDNLNTEYTVISPEKARNLKFNFSGDIFIVSFNNLTQKFSIEDLPENFLPKIINCGLKSCKGENIIIHSKNNQHYISFYYYGEPYKLFFAETGLPLKITGNNSSIIFKQTTLR